MHIFDYITARIWLRFFDDMERSIRKQRNHAEQQRIKEEQHKENIESLKKGTGYWKNTTGHPENDNWVYVEHNPLYEKKVIWVSCYEIGEGLVVSVDYSKPRKHLMECMKCDCVRTAQLAVKDYVDRYTEQYMVHVDKNVLLYDN